MRRAAQLALFFSMSLACARANEHDAKGLILSIDPPHHSITVSCEKIPGYMPAMEMPLLVRDQHTLAALTPGALIRFHLVEQRKKLYAENIQPIVNFEAEPAEAGALSALNSAVNPGLKPIAIGESVPDFTLTDQAQQPITLSALRGKVVALTFGYSRCPNPNYCLRLSRNLAAVEQRFHAQAGRDLILVTIAIDPEYDQGPALAAYARSFHADPQSWHFLTGPLPQIKEVAAQFGLNFWTTEGLLTHTLHTVVIDREGRLAANIDGNAFTPRQLGDLVQTVLRRPS
jgi:protein SCO1/2